MKYIILAAPIGDSLMVYPVIFPEYLTHSQVAKRMEHCVMWEHSHHAEVFSAGFCAPSQSGGMYVTRHGSESLRIDQNPDRVTKDNRLLNLPNALQGLVAKDIA